MDIVHEIMDVVCTEYTLTNVREQLLPVPFLFPTPKNELRQIKFIPHYLIMHIITDSRSARHIMNKSPNRTHDQGKSEGPQETRRTVQQ